MLYTTDLDASLSTASFFQEDASADAHGNSNEAQFGLPTLTSFL